MTPELVGFLAIIIAIVGLGVALAMFIHAGLGRLEGRIDTLAQRISGMEQRMSAIEQRLARLEGVLDGLREALFSVRAS